MTELKSRIGPKLYNNKSWVRPSFEASPNKLGPHIWDTSDSTNEGNSDPESHNDDGAFNPPHPPTSFSNPTSPPKSLLDRMKMPIIDESLHDRPEIRELRKVQRPLIERVDFGGKTDGTFESQSRFHNIEDGMDIDQDNDSEMSSEINNQIQRAKDIHVCPFSFLCFGGQFDAYLGLIRIQMAPLPTHITKFSLQEIMIVVLVTRREILTLTARPTWLNACKTDTRRHVPIPPTRNHYSPKLLQTTLPITSRSITLCHMISLDAQIVLKTASFADHFHQTKYELFFCPSYCKMQRVA